MCMCLQCYIFNRLFVFIIICDLPGMPDAQSRPEGATWQYLSDSDHEINLTVKPCLSS